MSKNTREERMAKRARKTAWWRTNGKGNWKFRKRDRLRKKKNRRKK